MATPETLATEIATQTTLLNDLRLQKAEAPLVEDAKKKLGELKKTLATLRGGGAKYAGKKKERLLLKTAKVRPAPLRYSVFQRKFK